jgi:hypothetical protein
MVALRPASASAGLYLTSPIRPAVPEFSPGKSLSGKERRGPKRLHPSRLHDLTEPHRIMFDPPIPFTEPMGADTLGWFQYGSQRISARLTPQRAQGLSGKVRLSLDIGQVPCSIR